MPFAGYENFEACVLDQMKKGHVERADTRDLLADEDGR
jgi:hypothetical protein